jgi:acetoin utilization deacetylase AcuC-like enzyme
MEIIFSEKCLGYDLGEHPEKPFRIDSAYKILAERGYDFFNAEKAAEKDLLLVHTQEHLRKVRKEDKDNEDDEDTPFVKGIYDYAALAVGGAIRASEMALDGRNSFSLMRPPGHHASKERASGFCYFNNIAVASKKLLNGKKIGKIAILDTDLHHGNGTEAIFLGQKDMLYASLHLYPAYPGTGKKHLQNSFNFPLARNTDEKRYLKSLEDALSIISDFKPEILAVSAGFDTYKDDPIESRAFLLELDSFRKIGQKIKNLNLPTFSVMEGGYSKMVGECVYEFISGME